jgi:hypothetical protein
MCCITTVRRIVLIMCTNYYEIVICVYCIIIEEAKNRRIRKIE